MVTTPGRRTLEFVGMEPLKAEFPNVVLRSGDAEYDLHNSGTLTSIGIDRRARRLTLRWDVREERPGASSAERRARLALHVDGIEELEMSGSLLADQVPDEELDFIFVQRAAPHIAFEMVGGARLVAVGTTCTLELVHGG